MAQPTLETVEMDAGSGGSKVLVDEIGASVAPVSLTAYSTGDGTLNVVTDSGTESLPVDITGAALTALQLLDDAIAGTEMQVDIVAPIPAGNNNIGNVDIVSLPSTLHSEDYDSGAGTDTTLAMGLAVAASGGAAVITGDVTNGLDVDVTRVGGTVTVDGSGVTQPVSGTVTANAGTGTFTVDGSGVTQPISGTVTANGGTGTFTVDNGGTFATQVDGAALTALQLIDDVVQTADSAAGGTDSGVGLLVRRDDEKTAFGADGDYVIPTADRFGALRTTQLPDATSEVKYAVINAATSGDNTIQAAAGVGIKIRVLSVFLIASGAVNVRFESGAGVTALTGQMPLIASSGFSLDFNPAGWFETADNAILNLELSAAVGCHGSLSYVEV